ncbi:MAG: hypothetical protein FD131_4430 [Rhodocyclaceae bacterium]|nr:MAG: hypothetical protein FD131_4430 [Rhodocyclaceae bacterium]
MAGVHAARTLSVSIRCDPKAVCAFVSDGANLPRWATAFCQSATPAKDGWLVETPQGPVTIRLAGQNPFGVVDHDVVPASGPAVHVPMRIVPNGSGSEVLFTLFRTPEMSDERFAEDLRLVEQDLATLKRVLERA